MPDTTAKPHTPRVVRTHEHTAADKLLAVVAGPPGKGGAPIDYYLRGMANRWTENIDLKINFQTAPVHEVGITGVTMEALLAVIIDRLEGFQSGAYPCDENEAALRCCRLALINLNLRTSRLTGEGDIDRHGVPKTAAHDLLSPGYLIDQAITAIDRDHPENTMALNALNLAAAALTGEAEAEIDLDEYAIAHDPDQPEQEPGAPTDGLAPGTPDLPGERETHMGNSVIGYLTSKRTAVRAEFVYSMCAMPGTDFIDFWAILESLKKQGFVSFQNVQDTMPNRGDVLVALVNRSCKNIAAQEGGHATPDPT